MATKLTILSFVTWTMWATYMADFFKVAHGLSHYGSVENGNSITTRFLSGHTDKPRLCGSTGNDFNYNIYDMYRGPLAWWRISPCCQGRQQSPIKLYRWWALCGAATSPQYSPEGYIPGTLSNTGLAVIVRLESSERRVLLHHADVTGLRAAYVPSNVHIHFGNSARRGSEHVIDDQQYHGEIHIVHYKAEYGSVESATTRQDGLVVIAVPLSTNTNSFVSDHFNELMQKVAQLLRYEIGHQLYHAVNPKELMPDRPDAFFYSGSLTTPPCSESVQFIVMTQPVYISPEHLEVLWRLPSAQNQSVPISRFTNVRPLQADNGRIIRTNVPC